MSEQDETFVIEELAKILVRAGDIEGVFGLKDIIKCDVEGRYGLKETIPRDFLWDFSEEDIRLCCLNTLAYWCTGHPYSKDLDDGRTNLLFSLERRGTIQERFSHLEKLFDSTNVSLERSAKELHSILLTRERIVVGGGEYDIYDIHPDNEGLNSLAGVKNVIRDTGIRPEQEQVRDFAEYLAVSDFHSPNVKNQWSKIEMYARNMLGLYQVTEIFPLLKGRTTGAQCMRNFYHCYAQRVLTENMFYSARANGMRKLVGLQTVTGVQIPQEIKRGLLSQINEKKEYSLASILTGSYDTSLLQSKLS